MTNYYCGIHRDSITTDAWNSWVGTASIQVTGHLPSVSLFQKLRKDVMKTLLPSLRQILVLHLKAVWQWGNFIFLNKKTSGYPIHI